jgi:hypothetical protein
MPRLDGVVGDSGSTPSPGGIFGQRPSPSNQFGIFETQWALPEYVENEAVQGGVLDPYTLKPDLDTALPIERNITGGIPDDDNLVLLPGIVPDEPELNPITAIDVVEATPVPKKKSWKGLAIFAAVAVGAIIIFGGE